MEFLNPEKPIDLTDIATVEARIGRALPKSFKNHYLKFNGGIPERAWLPGDRSWEAIEVKSFFPIKYNERNQNLDRMLLDGKYLFMRKRNVIPKELLPFANDPGGNFICLDLLDGCIKYYATDSFDSDLSAEENHKLQQRQIASSFEDFLNRLTTAEAV